MKLRIILIAIISLLLAGLVAGVFATGGQKEMTTTKLKVVAAENFYGDIARQIGGSHASVTSVLSDPTADPHLYEPETANGLAVANADLVIQNGLGFDAFMEKLEKAAPSSDRVVITIADALELSGADTNPHIWYDVPRLGEIGAAIASGLERADPDHASAYRAGLARFDASLHPLDRVVARMRVRFAGEPVAFTEPLPAYLIEAAGLRDLTPRSFSQAIENGSEPSPEAVARMTALMTGKEVRALLYNVQVISPTTTVIRRAAVQAGIPVVAVSATLPHDLTFQSWLLSEAKALEKALAR
jgi:zinc/manganese transport system substrate-binding protein